MIVEKRDGRKKEFDINRIKTVIGQAYKEAYGSLDNYIDEVKDVVSDIENQFKNNTIDVIAIEDIQDIVVESLSKINKHVAEIYQDYREERTFARDIKSDLDLEIDRVIKGISEESTANGNVDGSKIQSIRAIITNIVCRNYARRHKIPKKIRKKHKKMLYIHDEYYFALPFWNCCVADWENMFEGGFVLGTTRIERPKSLATAVNVLTQVASHIASNTYGGTTFANLVKGLTPYGKMSLNKYRATGKLWIKDEESAEAFAWSQFEKEVADCAQSIEYEIQTLMTSRGN